MLYIYILAYQHYSGISAYMAYHVFLLYIIEMFHLLGCTGLCPCVYGCHTTSLSFGLPFLLGPFPLLPQPNPNQAPSISTTPTFRTELPRQIKDEDFHIYIVTTPPSSSILVAVLPVWFTEARTNPSWPHHSFLPKHH